MVQILRSVQTLPINPQKFAVELQQALGLKGPPSAELIGEATAIQMEIAKASVTFAPGSITGIAPSGGPLVMGMGVGGAILGMAGPSLASNMQKLMGKPSITPQLQGVANAIVTHVMTGLVGFPAGGIVAMCSNSATSPGAVTGLACTGGSVSGLSGKILATLMAPLFGGPPSPQLLKYCDAICNHITANALGTIGPGLVAGSASAGGGPIAMGTAAGGKLS